VAIEFIEEYLDKLKARQQEVAKKRGINLDNLDDLKNKVKFKAFEEYDLFIKDKRREDDKKLCIKAYEEILHDQRLNERSLLNLKRTTEIDKNRPPLPGWYMGRDKEFSKELYRNRVEMRPRGQNSEYLKTLKDQNIY
jgi:hypothetical protein